MERLAEDPGGVPSHTSDTLSPRRNSRRLRSASPVEGPLEEGQPFKRQNSMGFGERRGGGEGGLGLGHASRVF